MKKLKETELTFRLLTLFVFLAFALVYSPSAFAQDPPAFPDSLTYTLNGDNPADAGGYITTGTAGGQIYRGEGTTWVPWGTTCLPGWVATAGVPPDPTSFYCVSPASVSPAVDYVITGNWSSLSGAVLNNNLAVAPATSVENYRQCLGCHYHQSSGNGTPYLMTGHKNTLRKVPAGSSFQTWNGPDGLPYNSTDAYYGSGSTYSWSAGTVTVGGCDPLSTLLPLGLSALDPGCSYTGYGTTQNLLYLMGGWLYFGGDSTTGNPHLNTVFDSGAIAGFTGEQYPNGNFDCMRCHATGYNFVAAGSTTGSAITGSHEVAGPEPTIQTSTAGGGTYGGGTYSAITDAQMSRWPTDQTSGDSSWYLTGVQCERCHIAEASYKTTGGVLEIVQHEGFSTGTASQSVSGGLPTDLRATALCMECHRQETVSTVANTITPTYPPVAVDAGYCSDLTTKSYTACTAGWVYMPTMSHAQGSQFLNSPHAEYTGTVTQNAQNSADLSVNITGTFGAIVPTPEGGYFMETSGADDAQNKGCTNCHDPHYTTVVPPAQYNANPALLHSLQGPLATNCNNSACHSTIGTNLLATIKHPVGPGTPFPNGGTDADVPGACVTCHMQAASPNPTNPTQGVAQSHFFRISVDPNYYTFPTAAQYYSGAPGANALNVATDTVTGFTAAIYNDVDVACGQCHGGGNGSGQNPYGIAMPNPAPPAFARTYLASAATGIHGSDGLFTTVATPKFSPVAGTYATAQTVSITSTTVGATICYTTNGTVPQAGDPGTCAAPALTYTGPIVVPSVGATETLEALATLNGDINSAVATAAYKITLAATPTFSPVAGSYATAQTVTITSTTSGATICYTTDGIVPTAAVAGTCDTIDPTEASVVSPGKVSVPSTETVTAIATIASGYSNSASVAAAYIISTTAVPTFSPAAGSYASAQTAVKISSATAGATICYTINGTLPTAATAGTCDANVGESSMASGSTISVSVSETVNAIATLAGYTNSYDVGAAYVIPTALSTPTFSPAAGTYATTQTVTITSTSTAGATICYTTNGGLPTAAVAGTCDAAVGESSMASGSSITVSSTETVEALATKLASTNSAVASGTFTIQPVAVATPKFSPVAGSYTGKQTVSITSTTAGATICYTTNGSTPTAATAGTCDFNGGVEFSGGTVTVGVTEQLAAIATLAGDTNSAAATAAYTITAAAPTFSPVAGSYTGTQTVAITSTTVGATICFTTDGSTPQDWPPGTCQAPTQTYSVPISVTASETVKALATLTGEVDSAIASAAYVITAPVQAATPTFSLAPGIYYTPQTMSLADSTLPAPTICYTTNGSTPAPGATSGTCATGTPYTLSFGVSAPTTIEAIAGGPGFTASSVATETVTVKALAPSFSPGGGTYSGAQTVKITDNASSPTATIYYAFNGAPTSANPCASPCSVAVSASETLEAVAAYDAGLLSESSVTSATYKINAPAPTFSPGAGTYKKAQGVNVTLADPSCNDLLHPRP